MKNWIHDLLQAAHKFTATDFALFKICLLSIGILLGTYFSNFFHSYIFVIWTIGIVTCIGMVVLLVLYLKKSGVRKK